MGLQALAAMRQAMAELPPRQTAPVQPDRALRPAALRRCRRQDWREVGAPLPGPRRGGRPAEGRAPGAASRTATSVRDAVLEFTGSGESEIRMRERGRRRRSDPAAHRLPAEGACGRRGSAPRTRTRSSALLTPAPGVGFGLPAGRVRRARSRRGRRARRRSIARTAATPPTSSWGCSPATRRRFPRE